MAVSAVPASAPPPPGVGAATSRGFAAFDDRVVSAHPGLVVLRADSRAHEGLITHAARRLRTSGFDPVVVLGGPAVRSLVRELALQLGVRLDADALPMAEALVAAAEEARAVLLVTLPDLASWDGEVLAEIARSRRLLVIGVSEEAARGWSEEASEELELGATLQIADRLRWLGAIAEEAQQDLTGEALPDLEAWWRRARAREPELEVPVGAAAGDLLHALVIVGRSVPLTALRDRAALDELVRSGLVRVRAGRVLIVGEASGRGEASSAAHELARELLGEALDPWDALRTAELLAASAPDLASAERADEVVKRAFEEALDARAASDLAERWFAAVARVTGEAGLLLRRRSAERALASGDAHAARRWCESASTLASDPEIELLRGRALVLSGDLVAARVSLQRVARAVGRDDTELAARVSVELANLALAGGRHDEANREARRAASETKTHATRLAARNVLGKVLLAQSRWDEADAHFAEDAMLATAAGDETACMRSVVNRAIATLSKGRLEDAREMLERVLEQATKGGEPLAASFALSNLAVIALRRQDYGRALAHWEEAVQRGQALRGRVGVAQILANLAELRLRLGLVEHAEHAVAFGRRLLGGSDATSIKAHFRRVAAEIALQRGRTDAARTEIEAALGDALAAANTEVTLQVWLVSARVALEEGDLARVNEALTRASELPMGDRGRAEVALLRAREQRARGADVRELAEAAVTAAIETRSLHFEIEAHVLAASAQREAGEPDAAELHMASARRVCGQIAASLSEELRVKFLARSHLALVCREEPGSSPSAISREGLAMCAARGDARRIVGQDPQVRALLGAVRKVARSSSTVLVRGESGTGKELVAEEIHRQSPRAAGPLVSVNCAALVETLLLSELFGHEKGAFTGASARRRGRFEMAEGGTLFLDEIGDISPKTQVALLRVLQEKTFERVGGTTSIRADVRVVCATHRDLRKMVLRGEFREDLYYRLAEIVLEVPSLRSRSGDLREIATHLLGRIAFERGEPPKALSTGALGLLARHGWPGNVRELENVLRAASLFAEGEAIEEHDLTSNVEDLRVLAATEAASTGRITMRPPESGQGGDEEEEGGAELPPGEATATAVAYAQVRRGNVGLSDLKRQIERDCIVRALGETKGNITRAAALLGMKRPRLSQLAKAYGITGSSEGT